MDHFPPTAEWQNVLFPIFIQYCLLWNLIISFPTSYAAPAKCWHWCWYLSLLFIISIIREPAMGQVWGPNLPLADPAIRNIRSYSRHIPMETCSHGDTFPGRVLKEVGQRHSIAWGSAGFISTEQWLLSLLLFVLFHHQTVCHSVVFQDALSFWACGLAWTQCSSSMIRRLAFSRGLDTWLLAKSYPELWHPSSSFQWFILGHHAVSGSF